MAKLIVFGAGTIAKLAQFYFERDSEHQVAAFTVDTQYLNGTEYLGCPLVDFAEVEERFPPSEYKAFVGLSYSQMNAPRAETCQRVKAKGYELVSYVSSRCTNLADQPVGENCFILEDNTIQPFVQIGNNVTLWSGNHIGHESVIGDNCFITSHVVVSGNVTIGANCFIGVNATLRNNITIGERCLIVAGATILKSTEPDSVYAGPRAEKLLKKSSSIKL